MKRIMKVFTVLLLAVCMTLSSLPVSAADAAGNDLLQKGEVSVEEAILINLFQYADTLYDTCNRMVPMQVIYNLGRFGTVSVPDDAAFIETDVSCTFISKSKAKSLNV